MTDPPEGCWCRPRAAGGAVPNPGGRRLLALHRAAAPDALRDAGRGTGIVAARFMAAGYAVTGLDPRDAPGGAARGDPETAAADLTRV